MSKLRMQAHRGVSTEYPENTMTAFRAAAAQGYPIIELDPAVTKDGAVVVLHDGTVNRTGRRADGTAPETPTPIRSLTLAEARALEYGSWFGAAFCGEPIPLLSDVLAFADEAGLVVKIDNKYQNFPESEQEALFAVLRGSSAALAITFSTLAWGERIAAAFPAAELHYDGPVTEENLHALAALAGGRRPTVWLAYPCRRTDWVKVPRADEALCALVKRYADLGVWILAEEEERRVARDVFRCDVIETTGSLKP